ncbi:MAG: hypothetical protein KAR19_16875 [Bacteroidales bacterium]|nr:hypothetical protein [Bacteroidales bacterium]
MKNYESLLTKIKESTELYMGRVFLDSKRYEEAYTYYSRYFSQLETTGDLDVNDMNRMGYGVYAMDGLDPLFESIRQEERFQQLVGKMEAKYQAEHERVRKWLDENEML